MSNPRAVKYRRLALAEPNVQKAQLLRTLADEAEKGILVTSETHRPAAPKPGQVPVTVDHR